MSAWRILVTGASGLLGATLIDAWADHHELCALSGTRKVNVPRARLVDLRTGAGLAEALDDFQPTHVVHAAALTDVDYCERNPDEAQMVNAVASETLARLSRKSGARFVYVSTEAVFDGERGGYRESDRTRPVNVYATSKLDGERRVLNADPTALVLRVGLEGWRPVGRPGFVQWIVDGLRRGEPRNVCVDWSHTLAFAANVPLLLERFWAGSLAGVFHVAGGPRATNMDIALRAAEIFDLDDNLLTPISSGALKLNASRPRDVSMVSERMPADIASRIWTLDKGIREMRHSERAGVLDRLRSRLAA